MYPFITNVIYLTLGLASTIFATMRVVYWMEKRGLLRGKHKLSESREATPAAG